MLTRDSNTLGRLLPTSQENHALLRYIDIVILQEEDLVNAVILKRREFDEDPNRTCE